MNCKILILFCCIFFGLKSVKAQNKTFNKAPLKEVLIVLEKEYDIKFSFSEKDLDSIIISLDTSNTSLEELLERLSQATDLKFKKITNRYIAITKLPLSFTIEGKLTDAKTEKPLWGGTIAIVNEDRGSVTDEEGKFKLKNVKENDTINVSFMGYQNQQFLASEFKENATNLAITLQESSNVLTEILIQNYLTNGMVKRNDGSEEFRPQVLGILPGLTEPDVLQSIQLLPGVQSPNETASGLHIRGGTPDQNLILFDGIKMYNSAHFFGMVSAFNPYIAQKTKVFRSGASTVYGNYISGVIDIESDQIIPEKFNGGIGTNLIHLDGYIKTPIINNIGLIVAGRRSFTDAINTITFNKLSNKVFQNTVITENNQIEDEEENDRFNEFFYSDINAKLLINASKKDHISLSYLHNGNKLNYSIDDDDITEANNHNLQFFNIGASGIWDHIWTEKLKQKTTLYYSNYDLTYAFRAKNESEIIEQFTSKTNIVKEFQAQSFLEWTFKNNNKLKTGYETTFNDVSFNLQSIITPENINDIITYNNNNTSQALFAEYIKKNTNKTSLNLGLRANYFSLTKNIFFSPRLYFQTKINSNSWFKASAEIKQQNISKIVEFFTEDFGLENQVWALSNKDDIPILESNQVSIGYLFKKNKWTLDIDIYRKNIHGLTSLSSGFNNQIDDYFEGESTSYGLDVFLKKEWKFYNSWISYSLTDTQFLFDEINNNNSFAGNYDVRHQFLWTNSLKIKQFNFSLGWSLRSGIPYTNASGLNNEDNVIYEKINAKRLPVYHRLDFSSTYQFSISKTNNRWKGKIGFSLLNIYNQKNTLFRSYNSKYNNTTDSHNLVKRDTYSLGITPNIVLRINF